jgi:hypothetical protein
MNRFFAFIGRTAERLTGKKFFATVAYLIIEAYCRVNGLPFSPEALGGLVTYLLGQTVADMKTKPAPIDKVLPLAFACATVGIIGVFHLAGEI